MKMVSGSFVKERESLSCCDWFSMKLHEMMFRIKPFSIWIITSIMDSALKDEQHPGEGTRYIPGWGGAARLLVP